MAGMRNMLLTTRRLVPGRAHQLLRSAKETFREGPRCSHFCRLSSRTLWTKQSNESNTENSISATATVLERLHPAARNTQPSGGGSKLDHALGLKEFMHRQHVLGLYRGILKQARILKETGVADEARRQFRTTRDKTDPLMLRAAISEAEWYLESMMQSSKKHGLAGDPGRSNKGGSWMDVDDPGDERGRVGEGFPWER